MNQKLTTFLDRKGQVPENFDIELNHRKINYIKAVDELYLKIESMLQELVDKGNVKVYTRDRKVSETYLGEYNLNEMYLIVGKEHVRFLPKGCEVVGALGRIDIVGYRGESTLLMQEDGWHSLVSRSPLITKPFDEESLTAILMTVMSE